MKRLFNRRSLIWLAFLPVVAVAMYLLPWQDIIQTLSALTWIEIVILLLLNGFILLLFASRWWLILRAQGHPIPYLKLAAYRIAGFSISYFTPGTQFGGEPLQIYLVQNRHAVPGTTSTAAVALDKLFELLANFTFLAVGVLLTVNGGLITGISSPNAAIPVIGLLALPLIYLLLLRLGKYPVKFLIDRLPTRLWSHRRLSHLPALLILTEQRMSGLFLRKPLIILWVLFLSGMIWFVIIFEYWLMAYFLGARLTLMQSVAGLTASRLSFLTPLPGAVGIMEGSQVLAMKAFGYSATLGLSLSLLIRARDVTLGLIGLGLVGGLAGKRFSPVSSLMEKNQVEESGSLLAGD
jgi:hypothetical protein